jgi:hypothetical protein
MKKIILVAAVAMLALASCKKDRTCSCDFTVSDSNFGNFSLSLDTVYTDMKKADAETLCESNNASLVTEDGTTTIACELK